MLGLDLVAVDFLTAVFEIEGMKIQPMFSGDEGEDFFEVRAQFVRRAGTARIVAGYG